MRLIMSFIVMQKGSKRFGNKKGVELEIGTL